NVYVSDYIIIFSFLSCFFFFSSRRRHTRCYRDWSSDVCSSDLGPLRVGGCLLPRQAAALQQRARARRLGAERRRPGRPRASGQRTRAAGAVLAATAGRRLVRRGGAAAAIG